MELHSQSSDELQKHAAAFVAKLLPADHATIVTLSGELGAGKTAFAQGIAKALGVKETVNSPTFVIEKVYELKGQKWQRLVHIDAYRLNPSADGAHELEVLGWKELIADQGNLIVLEWPERVEGAIPKGAIAIKFDIDGDGRKITINDGEEKSAQG
jgi:tRNA threonylcarbamoyladenosine biosynthesis protein TsaE